MEDVAKILREAHEDLTTAWGLASKDDLPAKEQRAVVRALLRQVHERIVDAYKIIAFADAPAEADELAEESIPA